MNRNLKRTLTKLGRAVAARRGNDWLVARAELAARIQQVQRDGKVIVRSANRDIDENVGRLWYDYSTPIPANVMAVEREFNEIARAADWLVGLAVISPDAKRVRYPFG